LKDKLLQKFCIFFNEYAQKTEKTIFRRIFAAIMIFRIK